MSTQLTTEQFTIPKSGYVAFDAMSLRQLIIDRLTEQGTFTDQVYVGSNLASIIDIVAYAYNTLIYYLNKTSTESMYTEAQLFENINRIVKLIDYSPVGFQTSTLSFNCSALDLPLGLYTIPRYSFLTIQNISFSVNEDLTFSINSLATDPTGLLPLTELSQQKLMYQGVYQEYPLYTATGEDNEVLTMNVPTGTLIDHYNIDVYVKSIKTGVWEQFNKTVNLYLEPRQAKAYEVRLNPNKRYEIKFGNNTNGYKLQAGDQIAVYYLVSRGENGLVGPNALNNTIKLKKYNSTLFNEIITSITKNQYEFLDNTGLDRLSFTNTYNSTNIQEIETPDQIRESAAANYKTQYRVVTDLDYETFIKTNFANFITDLKVINNQTYIDTYLKYFYEIGLTSLSQTSQPLLNQVLFADSCNFNNVYVVGLARGVSQNYNYLTTAQKEIISNALSKVKVLTTDTIFVDPVYKALTFGINETGSFDPVADDPLYSLNIYKESFSRRNNENIKNDVVNIFLNYFDQNNIKLGQIIDIQKLTQEILAIDGVQNIDTVRYDEQNIIVKTSGLSFYYWNILYPNNDKTVLTNNTTTRIFEVPFLYNRSNLVNKIRVINTV
jgi:hypothetical protein